MSGENHLREVRYTYDSRHSAACHHTISQSANELAARREECEQTFSLYAMNTLYYSSSKFQQINFLEKLLTVVARPETCTGFHDVSLVEQQSFWKRFAWVSHLDVFHTAAPWAFQGTTSATRVSRRPCNGRCSCPCGELSPIEELLYYSFYSKEFFILFGAVVLF